MSLSLDDVAKVALLSRLRLTAEELQTMTTQLAQVVEYMDVLKELNVDGVSPMAHAVELSNVFRADEVQPSLPREAALSNAPHHDGEFYRVPAVLGE